VAAWLVNQVKAAGIWPEAVLWFLPAVVCYYLSVFSPARVATWRAFEVAWGDLVSHTMQYSSIWNRPGRSIPAFRRVYPSSLALGSSQWKPASHARHPRCYRLLPELCFCLTISRSELIAQGSRSCWFAVLPRMWFFCQRKAVRESDWVSARRVLQTKLAQTCLTPSSGGWPPLTGNKAC